MSVHLENLQLLLFHQQKYEVKWEYYGIKKEEMFPSGHGGSNGAYYQAANIVPGINCLNDNNVVKSSA
jgi:hypothetical protein